MWNPLCTEKELDMAQWLTWRTNSYLLFYKDYIGILYSSSQRQCLWYSGLGIHVENPKRVESFQVEHFEIFEKSWIRQPSIGSVMPSSLCVSYFRLLWLMMSSNSLLVMKESDIVTITIHMPVASLCHYQGTRFCPTKKKWLKFLSFLGDFLKVHNTVLTGV